MSNPPQSTSTPVRSSSAAPLPPSSSSSRTFDPTREAPRTFAEADAYFRKLSGEGAPHIVLSPARARWVGVAGWAAGAVACGYMVLWADFGDKEHVFSPIRRAFHRQTTSFLQLSDQERQAMGLSSSSAAEGSTSTTTTTTTHHNNGAAAAAGSAAWLGMDQPARISSSSTSMFSGSSAISGGAATKLEPRSTELGPR